MALIARSLQLLVALGGAYLVALWFALILWTFHDIQLRSRSVIAQIFSTLVVFLFFIPGVIVYLILRPRDTLDEAFQRSLEEEYLLQDLEELPLCPTCQHFVEADYVFCPHCRTELKQPCGGCGRVIDLRWEICPFCGEEQYGEELPPLVAEEWEPDAISARSGGVGRIFMHARDRLGGRRAHALDEPESEATLPLDQTQQAYLPWESEPIGAEPWARRPQRSALGSDGASWDDHLPASENGNGALIDPTDEIPLPPRPHS